MGKTSEEYLKAVTIGERKPLDGPVELLEYDPEWPAQFRREEEKIRGALGDRALQVEHVGSTAVPGLAAKPVIDIVLVIDDTTNEPGYVPDLEAAGYALRIREPDWFEHRLFNGPDTDIGLHVFSAGCPEIEQMLTFRDRLRSDAADRKLYEQTKRELAARNWRYTQHYADAKGEVVEEILARAVSRLSS